jgi:uncharacterized protein (DUF362 family)
MPEKHGEVIYRTWNYEIRKEKDTYYGYELKATKKPTTSFSYIHKIEGEMPNAVSLAMDKIELNKIVKSSDRVIIKVNLCGGFKNILASQTPLKLVEGLVDKLRNIIDNKRIYLAEANNWGHVVDDPLLKRRGYFQFCERTGVTFLKLSYRPTIQFYFRGFDVPILLSRELLLNRERTKLINATVPKHHWECGVTLAAKNLYGAIADESKTKFHDYVSPMALDMVIAGSARIHNPDLNILGGKCVCAGQGPHFCRPRRFGYLIISNDFLAADKIGADVLGFPYQLVVHAQINERLGIWNSSAPLLPGAATISEAIKRISRSMSFPLKSWSEIEPG